MRGCVSAVRIVEERAGGYRAEYSGYYSCGSAAGVRRPAAGIWHGCEGGASDATQGCAPPSHAACTVGAVEVGRSAGLASQMEEAAALSRLRSLQQRLDHKLDRCIRWPAGPVMGQMLAGVTRVPLQMWQCKAQS